MLQLNMVPPYVERMVSGGPASRVMVDQRRDDGARSLQQKISPPDVAGLDRRDVRRLVFHQLIADTDPNLTNLLITKDSRIWMIDFTRAFRLTKSLREPKNLTRVDRKLLANLRGLSREGLQSASATWLKKPQIEAVLGRSDLLRARPRSADCVQGARRSSTSCRGSASRAAPGSSVAGAF